MVEARRLVWPIPSPRVLKSFVNTIAFELIYLATMNPKIISSRSLSLIFLLVLIRISFFDTSSWSLSWTSKKFLVDLSEKRVFFFVDEYLISIKFFFLLIKSFNASSSKSGATTTSVNNLSISLAVDFDKDWLKATTPPNALIGSHKKALL